MASLLRVRVDHYCPFRDAHGRETHGPCRPCSRPWPEILPVSGRTAPVWSATTNHAFTTRSGALSSTTAGRTSATRMKAVRSALPGNPTVPEPRNVDFFMARSAPRASRVMGIAKHDYRACSRLDDTPNHCPRLPTVESLHAIGAADLHRLRTGVDQRSLERRIGGAHRTPHRIRQAWVRRLRCLDTRKCASRTDAAV